jgi:hypothetical protein
VLTEMYFKTVLGIMELFSYFMIVIGFGVHKAYRPVWHYQFMFHFHPFAEAQMFCIIRFSVSLSGGINRFQYY